MIPLAHVERIMRNAGAKRLSDEAIEELRDSAEEIAEEVAADAVRIAEQDGRSGITLDDVRAAIEH